MFNVINNKFMLIVNQLLIILLIILSFITISYMKGREVEVLLLFIIILLPYAMAVVRTRDFMQVDVICTFILLSVFVLNIIAISSMNLYDEYLYSSINLLIVLFGYIFQIVLYAIVYRLSNAVSEYRRFSSAIENTSFIHSINILVSIWVFSYLNKINVTYKLIVVAIASVLIMRVVTKLLIFVIVTYDVDKIGGADEDFKK